MKGLRARRRGRRAETPEENTERKPYESFIASRRLFFDAHHSNIQTQKAMLVSGTVYTMLDFSILCFICPRSHSPA